MDPFAAGEALRRTRLSRLHPYPAMVADELAVELAEAFVQPGHRVLDPFCGSGRLLAAATRASYRLGLDVNPLACLLARAKLASPDLERLKQVVSTVATADRSSGRRVTIDPRINGGVPWLSEDVVRSLGRLVAVLDDMVLKDDDLVVVAACLSATVREVSYARQEGWKLHRIGSVARTSFTPCPWDRFARRLLRSLADLSTNNAICGPHDVAIGDARCVESNCLWDGSDFDVVLTSPPYGDSRTTVQYGAASALCMSVVSKLRNLRLAHMRGNEIDRACLGGSPPPPSTGRDEMLGDYWRGARTDPSTAVVATFVEDYRHACRSIASVLRRGGRAVFIVGCRTVSGERLHLDKLTTDEMTRHGFVLERSFDRPLAHKRFPRVVNRFGRASDPDKRAGGRLRTMGAETVLVLVKL